MAITRMTFAQARKYVEENNERLQAAYAKAKPTPFVDDGLPPQIIARGLDEFQEYLHRRDKKQPQMKDKKLTIGIRLPESVVIKLRSKERYSRHIADYVLEGLASGALKLPS